MKCFDSMKKLLRFLIFLTLVFNFVCGKAYGFIEGEKLEYLVRFFGLPAGELILENKGIKVLDNKEVYHLECRYRTVGIFAIFHKVVDRMTSYVDKKTLLPVKFEKHLEEMDYRNSEITEFDHGRNIAVSNGKESELEDKAQDVISSLYYCRMQKLDVGDNIEFWVNSDEKNYKCRVSVLKEEDKNFLLGRFKTVVLRPQIISKRKPKFDGKATFWVTKDERKIPVRVKSGVTIGILDFVLTKADPPIVGEAVITKEKSYSERKRKGDYRENK